MFIEANQSTHILGRFQAHSSCPRPLAAERVPAGFPSPADDYVERTLDLNEYLVEHPAATYFVRVSGDSMTGAGIHDGDVLVVDRSVEPRMGHVVVAAVDGEFTVKRLARRENTWLLEAEHPDYPPIIISECTDFEVWGVVRHVIHSV